MNNISIKPLESYVVPNPFSSLLPGEHQLGEYQVTIARYAPSGWTATVPPLTAAVTNCRLILQPQTRRPYTPASIPSTYITKVADMVLDHRTGLMIALKTGHRLFLFTSWNSSGDRLSDALRAMLTSPIGAGEFYPQLDQNALRRLIRFISGL